MTNAQKTHALCAAGFIVGPRDVHINTRWPGRFMVVEAHDESELPTEDGSNGPWAVVGDDLATLVQTAYDVWADELEVTP